MPNSKFVLTYPVALVCSVVALCFTAILVVSLIQGESITVIFGAVGTLVSILGGLFAHSRVTPLERPRLPPE